jgi:ankyrin repeat protein
MTSKEIPKELTAMIERGDVQGVANALRADPSLAFARTPDGDTLLHRACWQKQIGILGTILAYEPDVNARGCNGRTPLHYAVQEGGTISVSIVGALLTLGADPSIRDDNGFSVEDLAKMDMRDGLADVLHLLRHPPKRKRP